MWRSSEGNVLVAQLCLTLCNPLDCSLSGSSVHGILQARVKEVKEGYYQNLRLKQK